MRSSIFMVIVGRIWRSPPSSRTLEFRDYWEDGNPEKNSIQWAANHRGDERLNVI